jgi:hypothetical protein
MNSSSQHNFRKTVLGLAVAGSIFLAPIIALADDEGSPPPAMHQSFSPAQRAEHMREHHEIMMREMRKIGLSPEQWRQVKQIDTDFSSRFGNGTMPSRKELKRHERAVMEVLTPIQRENLHHQMKMDFIQEHPNANTPGEMQHPMDGPDDH